MVYIFPNKRRNLASSILAWVPMFVTVLWQHPENGIGYATRWDNRGVLCR